MNQLIYHYEVTPKILRAGRKTTVTIRPLGVPGFEPDATYAIALLPFDESREPAYDYDVIEVQPANGCLSFSHIFPGEQEHIVRVFKPGVERKPENGWLNLRVYSLKDDLYARAPWRGDFHSHSTGSDGSEETEIVAANYRRAGFDFFAQTDHHNYVPSVKCAYYYADKPVDLHVMRGEEVHAPGNHVHIVNAGGKASVNEMFRHDPARYQREVGVLLGELSIPAGVNAFEYAASVWVFRKIRAVGGLAIFAHPHWMADVYHVPQALTDALFASGTFDAFELLGGHEVHSNNLQTAYYFEAREKGWRYPAVGSSDAHGTVGGAWFTWLSTLVFAEKNETPSILDAVREGYSVAVEQYPGEEYRVYGPYRLVKFARFLLAEYFPLHDDLCFEEGRLMRDMVLGDEGAQTILARLKGRVPMLIKKYYGKD